MTKVFCDICGEERAVQNLYVCKKSFDICEDCQSLIKDFFTAPKEARKSMELQLKAKRGECGEEFVKMFFGK